MGEWARLFLSELPLFVLTAVCTHPVISIGQTLFHYGLGHHRIGDIFYRNHIRFHHEHYAEGHLVSSTYRRNEGNNTPYFLIPTILVAGGLYLVLPLSLFVVTIATSAVSFSAHVYLDKQYHAARSSLARFAWFRRKQQLHFVRQQFRGDRLFLGQSSRDLPKSRHGRSDVETSRQMLMVFPRGPSARRIEERIDKPRFRAAPVAAMLNPQP
jgi:hypothetical protein